MNEFLQTHQNNLSKVSSKVKSIISDCESEEILNLNNMDDIIYRDLEFIISQMEFEQHLLFDSASKENSNSFTKSIGARK